MKFIKFKISLLLYCESNITWTNQEYLYAEIPLKSATLDVLRTKWYQRYLYHFDSYTYKLPDYCSLEKP